MIQDKQEKIAEIMQEPDEQDVPEIFPNLVNPEQAAAVVPVIT